MTRAQKLAALDALTEELRGEQRIEDWLIAHTEAQVWTAQSMTPHAHFVATVIQGGRCIAQARGDDEAEARKQAFSAVFTNEAAQRAG